MADLDKELERIEQGEAWHETDEVVEIDVKKPLDKVVPIRLQADDWAKLRREAAELGVGPTTLARMWILERLRVRAIPREEMARLFKSFLPIAPLEHSVSRLTDDYRSRLTPRQMEVLAYLAHGLQTKEISEWLGVTSQTVSSHIKAILQKLEAENEHRTVLKKR